MALLFEQKAPGIVRKLMADFDLTPEQAAGIVGNLGHETGGFKRMQEIKPVVKGSAGGFGWAQWTGPRRRAFLRWAKEQGLDPKSDAANYGFLRYELRTSEAAAIPAVRRTRSVKDATVAFERAFERAGVKHYENRIAYAERALRAYEGNPVAPDVEDVEEETRGKTPATSKTNWASAGAMVSGLLAAIQHPVVQGIALVALIACGVLIILERNKKIRVFGI